ncbi:ATP-binding protein [Nitriliruptoraceae bacterium ZYF776]|nr:ATP-binding protein [Profundirhabdus halotolerans]
MLSWSGGKDSVLALQALVEVGAPPDGLLTTVVGPARDVTHHEVPLLLVERQAAAVGLPLHLVELPHDPPNDVYLDRLGAALRRLGDVATVASGDLHLADLRAWREQQLAELGVAAEFPLWGRSSAEVARTAATSLDATVCVVDTDQLDARFVGRAYDLDLLAELPATVDPAGERGELHTFVTDAPSFARPVAVTVGAPTGADGRFVRAELVPAP